MTAFAAAVVVAAAMHYEVKVSGGARDLAIEARIPPFPDRAGELSVSGGALTVQKDLESGGGSTTRMLTYGKATS